MSNKQLNTDGRELPLDQRAKPISIYLPPDLYAEVEKAARKDERSISSYIKRVLAQAHDKGKDTQ